MTHPRGAAVGLTLGVDGALGEMDFPAVLLALHRGYELLDRTAHRVLGSRADHVRWFLTDLRAGSTVTTLEATPSDEVTERDLLEVVETYALDMSSPAERLPPEDLPLLRDLLADLERTDSGALFTQLQTTPDQPRVTVQPRAVLPLLVAPDRELNKVIGSVTGTLESLNVHGKREASLFNELDRLRVVVTFPEAFYERVHAAVHKRVEVFGVVQEDADGRPLRIRLQDLEFLPSDADLPTLSSLFGSMPGLTRGLSPEEYLQQSRQELGLG